MNIGLRYHLSNVNASVGISQLNKFNKISSSRIKAVKCYLKYLSKNNFIRIPKLKENIVPFIFYIRVDKTHREKLMEFLSLNKIETGIHWRPLHTLYISKNLEKKDLEITNKIAKQIITLPLYPDISNKEIKYICSKILSYCEKYIDKPFTNNYSKYKSL